MRFLAGFPSHRLYPGLMKIHTVLGIVAAALIAPAFGQEIPKVLEIGSPAPEFSLKGTDGKTHTLADYKDAKALCVIFTCNHCPDAVGAASRMEQIHQDYKGKGVAMVAVNANNPGSLTPDELGYSPYNDSFEEMTPFAKDYGWTFPYLYDGENQKFATACGAQATPHVFLFDGERKLVFTGRMDDMKRKSGPAEKSYLRDALDATLADKEVGEKTPRPFGCSTKWLFKAGNVEKDEESWKAKPVTVEDLSVDLAKKLRENGTDKIRLINFWSTTCGPCVAEFPELVETYRRFQNRPFEFISISIDPAEKKAVVGKFLTSRHAALSDKTAPSVKEEGRTTNNYIWTDENTDPLADAIDKEWTGALPHTVLLGKDGKILWKHTDKLDIVEVRRQIIKALAE
jgi:peroxiredoxin